MQYTRLLLNSYFLFKMNSVSSSDVPNSSQGYGQKLNEKDDYLLSMSKQLKQLKVSFNNILCRDNTQLSSVDEERLHSSLDST